MIPRGTQQPELPRRVGRRVVVAVLALGASLCLGQTEPFESWLADLRDEALARNISPRILDAALADLSPNARVIELDRNQPEFKLTLKRYLDRNLSETRIRRGRAALAENRALLERVRARFGVQPRFVVALWGIESNYGRTTGSFGVVEALATLAHEGRRAQFFRGELLDALQILDEGHIAPEAMRGSWAGAMGQPQFMPSSFRRHAVDFDGDRRRDIWTTRADVLASVASYLSSVGWRDDQTWGREVRVPAGLDPDLVGRDTVKTLPQWQALGVRRADGRDLPRRALRASLIRPDPTGPAYVVYDNFRTLLDWNRSEYFGVAVGLLSDRIGR